MPDDTLAVRARPRPMTPGKAWWLEDRFKRLREIETIYPNPQARFESVAMVVPKRDSYLMVTDIAPITT